MINANNIYVQYGDRILLDGINLTIGEKDKLGLVGRNGAGKSTFLKIIAGENPPQEGSIVMPTDSTLGFLHQEMDIPKGKTVMEETMTAFAEAERLEKEIEKMNDEMATRTDYTSDSYSQLLIDFSEANDKYLLIGGVAVEAEAEKVLKGLGFKNSDFTRLTDEFSGGWQMRIELAKMLLQRPNFLLLDEPTNHLDIESIIWLEDFLRDYYGAVVVISHDKAFLDNVTKRTVEISLGKTYDYKAGYSKYLELRKDVKEKQAAAFENQQKVIAQKERTITRFMAKATKTKMAQSMKKQLDKIDRIEIDDEDIAAMNIRFPAAPRSGEITVEATNVVKQYDELLVLNGVDLKLDRGDRVAFVGQNGQGKTTLAKILTKKLAETEGEVKMGHNVALGYYAQNQSDTLDSTITLLETMENHSPPEMRTKLRSILGAFLFSGDDVEKKVSVLSGGERARLALACMLLNPFNLLILDEPTNHLDMISKEVLKKALIEYDGTMIVVSHDRDFLADLTNRTIEFRDKQLYNHIGDVNAFLEKRKMDNMREVEMSTKQAAVVVAPTPGRELSYEERKQLLRAVSSAEKKIDKIEKKIAKIEVEMAKPAFYERVDSQKVMDNYTQAKQDLTPAMEAWEAATMAMEE
ncbi:MAG: ATP-binding cassette subfamily F protein 3 [Paraglaciecola sp.]|jgi:ATP-binding cassette subfamily F protein 3